MVGNEISLDAQKHFFFNYKYTFGGLDIFINFITRKVGGHTAYQVVTYRPTTYSLTFFNFCIFTVLVHDFY